MAAAPGACNSPAHIRRSLSGTLLCRFGAFAMQNITSERREPSPPSPGGRRLAAVAFVDIVGYSILMATDERATHEHWMAILNDILRPSATEHHGVIVKSTGDGVLAEFASALDAVEWARNVQNAVGAQNEAPGGQSRPIALRISVHLGDVISTADDIYGDGVNVAARLQQYAEPGGIILSEAVYDLIRGSLGDRVRDLGPLKLKNFPKPVRAFALAVESAGAAARHAPARDFAILNRAWFSRRKGLVALIGALIALLILSQFPLPPWSVSPPRAHASLMVLPFNNLSGDPDQGYFADAITEDLTTDLASLPGVLVIARATAFTFKGKSVDIRQIGRELPVHYVLEGSVRKIDSMVETNAQLIEAKGGTHLWAERFTNKLTDLIDLQHAVTGRIANSLNIQLVQAESRRALFERPNNPDSVDLRMQGIALITQSYTAERTLAARQFFQRAVNLDPNAAQAWSWLATVLASDYLNYWNNAGPQELARADEAVKHALSLDPNIAQAHFAAAYVLRGKGEHESALAAFDHAIALNPNFASAYAQKGNQLTNLGRPEEAPALAQKAIQLSPRDPSLGVFYYIIGRAYFLMKRDPEAVPWLEKSVQARSNLTRNRLLLISTYALLGRVDEARGALAEFDKRFPGYTLARVESNDEAHPLSSPVALAGLARIRDGLRLAGMLER
jgi:adenylate cyclase